MRGASLTVALLGLLWAGSVPALAQERTANPVATPHVAAAVTPTTVTPVRWYYGYGPGWYGWYRGPRYYYPYYGYVGPHYYGYAPYAGYYGTYYSPYYGFSYWGPRRSFYFGY